MKKSMETIRTNSVVGKAGRRARKPPATIIGDELIPGAVPDTLEAVVKENWRLPQWVNCGVGVKPRFFWRPHREIMVVMDAGAVPQAPPAFAATPHTLTGVVNLATLSEERPVLLYFGPVGAGVCRFTPTVARLAAKGKTS